MLHLQTNSLQDAHLSVEAILEQLLISEISKSDISMAAQIPADKTWFSNLKRSFVDVPIGEDQGIDTSTFLEASEATTTLFGT